MNPDEKCCPDCAEVVKRAAKVCKHCGLRFSAGVSTSPARVERDSPSPIRTALAADQTANVSEHVSFTGPSAKTTDMQITFTQWSLFLWGGFALAAVTGHPGWAGACFILWCTWPLFSRYQKAEKQWKSVRPDLQQKDADGLKFRLDYEGGQIATRKGDKVRVFPKRSIIAVDVERDGSSIQTITRGSNLVGAVLGGLIGGGVGAMVGATGGRTSTATTQDYITSLKLRITVDDPVNPFVYLKFFQSSQPVPITHPKVRVALTSIEKWRARFAMLMR